MDIVKLYRQTVAAKRLGSGTTITKARTKVQRRTGTRVVSTTLVEGTSTLFHLCSTGIARNNLQHLRPRRGAPITGQQFRAEWKAAKAPSSPVIGRYSAEKQREASYA